MKKVNLSGMTTKELVERFAQIGRAQDQALLGGQISKFNRLFDQMAEISKELKERPGDQRRELMGLYNFPNMQVRLKAAIHTLAVSPIEARGQLEMIAESKWFPQAGDAGMSLSNLNRGIFKPT
ncbi:DUF2019 domain-containing protein [Bradyrhizobium sp. G127]|jgi:hypothetical protein|uniref:DUF2019 domain-containing protein n=1 Tax=Bradyrhizobium sp. G127 TaxID=2904800 RepID=UPI001F211BF9|nr:DUF2019 domain-containing protein [Bradyrhizobium sp. G127]MCF2523023.1 DUF2019 domain-containing protein [Bradyrhizobium sp. G127]